MTGITETPAGTLHGSQGIAEPPLLSDPPRAPARSPHSPMSFTTTHPGEPITMSTIHGMLARLLEQTSALQQAQASTNHILDELRRSIPAPQENAEFSERLRRVETLAETLVRGQRVEQRPPGQPTGAPSNISRGGSSPGTGLQYSLVQGGGGMFSYNAAANPPPFPGPANIGPEANPLLHARGEEVSRSGEHAPDNVDVAKEAPTAIPSLSCIDRSNIYPPETQYRSVLTTAPLPSMIEVDGNRRLGMLDLPISPTSHAYIHSGWRNNISIEIIPLHEPPEETELKHTYRKSDEAPIIDLIRNNAQDSTAHRSLDPLAVSQTDREPRRGVGVTSSEAGPAHTRIGPDIEPESAENIPQVTVSVNEALCNQVTDLTNLVRQILVAFGVQKALVEQRWTERLHWKEELGRQIRELMDMASWLVEERTAVTRREEHRGQAVDKPGIEQVIDELRKLDVEHRELLQTFSNIWRVESARHNEEMIGAVRATANEQVPYNVQGYLDEFSKTLSTEVRMLLGEVGKLREERRNIQHEIGYLLTMQSTLVPGGEFGIDWPPEYTSPQAWPSPAGIPLPESPQPRPGWRAVSVRGRRRAPSPEPIPAPERLAPLWATWRPNPNLAPTPPSVEPNLLVPEHGSPGLFGPRTPRHSPRRISHSPGLEQPSAPERQTASWGTSQPTLTWASSSWSAEPSQDSSRRNRQPPWSQQASAPGRLRQAQSWSTWQPDPAWASTPSSAEPDLIVPDRGSPGLFGPRSPRDSPHDLPRDNDSPNLDSWGVGSRDGQQGWGSGWGGGGWGWE